MDQTKVFSMKEASSIAHSILHEVQKVVIGKDKVILKVLLAILANGHVLLEDMPGVGKTTLALSFAKVLNLDYHRIQFTPDVLPSDVTGFTVYSRETDTMDFKKGTAFCNLLLADEINRTSPKTQSALLQLMEESAVTVDGVTYPLPTPFCVLATQNPTGSVGTQMLPESQMDRFMFMLHMGYPDVESEVQIMLDRNQSNPLDKIQTVTNADELIVMQNTVKQIYMDEAIVYYIAEIAGRTRSHPMLRLGVSPRGSLALCAAAKATALLRGRDYVIPDDILIILEDTFAHRLVMNVRGKTEKVTPEEILRDITAKVEMPRLRRIQK
ncbi:MAG: MoxR family ATPase [Oscillospiraceae bacterium]|nr:MoxR family ATPase [Oscillospiraceae bacterium]